MRSRADGLALRRQPEGAGGGLDNAVGDEPVQQLGSVIR